MASDSTSRDRGGLWSRGPSRQADEAVACETSLTRNGVAASSDPHPGDSPAASERWRGRVTYAVWPFLFLLAFHVMLFGVPALAGYPVWTGGQRALPII